MSGGYGNTVTGFSTPHTSTSFHRPARTALDAAKSSDGVGSSFAKFCATATMTAFLWGSPALLAEQASRHNFPWLSGDAVQQATVASARDKASATGSRVNKDPYSLLRLSLPIKNKEVCCVVRCNTGEAISFVVVCWLSIFKVLFSQLKRPFSFVPGTALPP